MLIGKTDHSHAPRLRSALALLAALLSPFLPQASSQDTAPTPLQIHVAPHGNDDNPGTAAQPFASIQHAVETMTPGAVCILHEGTYRQDVRVEDKSGLPDQPLRFVAAPGEIPVISGLHVVDALWQHHQGSIYKVHLDTNHLIQLFCDKQMMVQARWPNRTIDELWDRSTWARPLYGSEYGKIIDNELAHTGIDWTGAHITLNVAHQWRTWSATVRKHAVGSATLYYPKKLESLENFEPKDHVPYWWSDDRYYLSGKLEALDSPGEWHFDKDEKLLYVWPPDGKSLDDCQVEYKTRVRRFLVKNSDHVQLEGLHFFGATFDFRSCNHCVVDRCHALFPNFTKHIGEKGKTGEHFPCHLSGSHNIVRNCSIGYSFSDGLKMGGQHNLAENNLIHDSSWAGSLVHAGLTFSGGNAEGDCGNVIRRNTVFNSGSPCIKFHGGRGHIVEYNHVWNGGLTSMDVSVIYTAGPAIAGSEIRYNWVHGCYVPALPVHSHRGILVDGIGIRGDGTTRGLIAHHNVVWNCGGKGIIIKGDRNRVYNNTVFNIGTPGSFSGDVIIPIGAEHWKPIRKERMKKIGVRPVRKQNARSRVFNNFGAKIVTAMNDEPLPQTKHFKNNHAGLPKLLTDPANLDFTPKPDSPLIDAGTVFADRPDTFVGKAPDIGAYEHGGEHWTPGYRNFFVLFTQEKTCRPPADAGRPGFALALPILADTTVSARIVLGRGTLKCDTWTVTPNDWMQSHFINVQETSEELDIILEAEGFVRQNVRLSADGAFIQQADDIQ